MRRDAPAVRSENFVESCEEIEEYLKERGISYEQEVMCIRQGGELCGKNKGPCIKSEIVRS